MNTLISQFFGDPYISLSCDAGECLSASPTNIIQPNHALTIAFITTAIIFVISVLIMLVYRLLHNENQVDPEEVSRLLDTNQDGLTPNIPCNMYFREISYTVKNNSGNQMNNERVILDKISGIVRAGEVMGVMGPSGSGKSTLLDVLASRNKSGSSMGDILINGQRVPPDLYRHIIGLCHYHLTSVMLIRMMR
jgi:ABC-type bacteriocin/lantibiotic exporter with double-glycine peptidase domain